MNRGKQQQQSKKSNEDNAENYHSGNDIRELKELFQLIDTDKSGSIDVAELMAVLNQKGDDQADLKERLPLVYQAFNELKSIKQPITEADFVRSICEVIGNTKTDSGIRRIFDLFDQSGKGYIDKDDLRYVCNQVNEVYNDEELVMMLHYAHVLNETHSNSELNFDEFKHIIQKTRIRHE